jgi:hypothetical protein
MKLIEVIVDTKGGISLETRGFAGTACREATQEMERALGIATKDQPTAEMFLIQQQPQQQSLGGQG